MRWFVSYQRAIELEEETRRGMARILHNYGLEKTDDDIIDEWLVEFNDKFPEEAELELAVILDEFYEETK